MNFFKYIWIISFSIVSYMLKSQDTIVYKNHTKEVVILKEVSVTEIKYKRFEMPDGPDYIILKSELSKIIFSNGEIENIATQTFGNTNSVNTIKICTYRNSKSNLKNLLLIAENHPTKKVELKKYAYSINKLKIATRVSFISSAAFGAVSLGILGLNGLLYLFNGELNNRSLTPVPYTLALGLGGLVCTLNLKKNLKKKRMAFVNLYNE